MSLNLRLTDLQGPVTRVKKKKKKRKKKEKCSVQGLRWSVDYPHVDRLGVRCKSVNFVEPSSCQSGQRAIGAIVLWRGKESGLRIRI